MKFLSYLLQKWCKTPALLGLDMSESAIRLLEIKNNYRQCEITAYAHVELPPTMARENNLFSQAIKSALQQAKFITREAVLALPLADIITKKIQLKQHLSAREIAEHIALESERYFSQPYENIFFDFEIMNNNLHPHTVDVDLVAAWRKTVLTKVAIAEDAGLKIKAVTTEPNALLHLLRWSEAQVSLGFISIRPNSFLLMVVSNKQLYYCREENYASVADLITAINRHCRFYHEQTDHQVLQAILLLGEQSQEFIDAVHHTTRLPTRAFNPFAEPYFSVPTLLKHQNTAWMLSFALALWNIT